MKSNRLTPSRVLSGPGVCTPSCRQVQTPLQCVARALQYTPRTQQEFSKTFLLKPPALAPHRLALRSVSALWCGGHATLRARLPALPRLETTSSSIAQLPTPKPRICPGFYQSPGYGLNTRRQCHASHLLTRASAPPLSPSVETVL